MSIPSNAIGIDGFSDGELQRLFNETPKATQVLNKTTLMVTLFAINAFGAFGLIGGKIMGLALMGAINVHGVSHLKAHSWAQIKNQKFNIAYLIGMNLCGLLLYSGAISPVVYGTSFLISFTIMGIKRHLKA